MCSKCMDTKFKRNRRVHDRRKALFLSDLRGGEALHRGLKGERGKGTRLGCGTTSPPQLRTDELDRVETSFTGFVACRT